MGQTQSPRDPFARAETGSAQAAIDGRIVAANGGRPLKRAQVVATARDFRGRFSSQTDETGRYVLTDLPAGRYTLTVSKPGYITLSYGQRRPRHPATPVRITAGQQLRNINLALPTGSVITGHVVDEDGAPLPLVTIRLLRYVYQRGQRQLVPVGTDRTDDRGQYRVFDLEPGDYFVSAIVSRQRATNGDRSGPDPARGAGPGFRVRGEPAQPDGNTAAAPLGYAPTYYPGVVNLVEAVSVTVGLSAELGGVDFAVHRVPTSTVSGVVFEANGNPATTAQVMIVPEDGPVLPGAVLGARVGSAGQFEVRDVPPGRYLLRAVTRGGFRQRRTGAGGGGTPTFASQALVIGGYDVTDLALVLAPGATVSGTLIFNGATHAFNGATHAEPADLTRIRVTANSLQPGPFPNGSNGRVGSDGAFVLENVPEGARLVRANGIPNGWMLNAVYMDGQDVIDTPLNFAGTGYVEGVRLILTDQVTQLSGVVHDGQGTALTDFTVIAFPIDEHRWGPASRHVRASRPDQDARYQILGLPAGEYLLTAVETVEQGEWYDPRFLQQLRPGALRVSLVAGDVTEFNLTLTSRTP